MIKSIPDITPPRGLNPKAKYFEEAADTCLNVDACIKIMQETNTPQSKRIERAFRSRLATNPQVFSSEEKRREQVFFDALNDLGYKTSFMPIRGTME